MTLLTVFAAATAGCYIQAQSPQVQPSSPPRAQPTPPPTREPAPRPVPADFSISLQRTACFGKCPIYTVTIDADGEVTFDGARFVAATGIHRARIEPDAVAALYAHAVEVDFFAMDECYCERRITDLPSAIVTVTMSGATKTVRHYKGDATVAPGYLELEAKIDELAQSSRWVEREAVE